MASTDRAEFDTIIVGSGPSGATVARSLSLEKRRVLVLEAGSDARVDYSFASQLRATRTSFVGQGIPVIRGFTLGRTSMLYYATAFDPPLEMFRSHGVDLCVANY
jgi:choline dehydrogenase-like flavoprotein